MSACRTLERDYTAVPPNRTFTSPSFDPNNLAAKSAAIAALLQMVGLDAADFCAGDCAGGRRCLPTTLLKDPTGPGDLALNTEPGGKKHYVLTTGPVGSIKLYSNNCNCL